MIKRVSKPVQVPDDERTTAAGLWMYAESYLVAADFLTSGGAELRHSAPIYFLYAHAVELTLKAFLRSTGVTTKQLKDYYRHDLTFMLDTSKTKGLVAAVNRPVLKWLDKESTDLRYIRTGYKRVPTLDVVGEVAAQLVEATKAACIPK